MYIFYILLVRFVYFCYLKKKLNDFNGFSVWVPLLIKHFV